MAETIQNTGMSLQPKEKQKQGTGYTNIQRVLGANVGSKLGSAVKTGIQQQAQGVQQQTQQAKSQFETGVAESRLDTDESKAAREAAIKRLSGPGYTGPSEEEVQQFGKFRAGQYGGPRSIENEQELLSKAADVSGMARGLGTAEGRQGILQQYVGQSPSYSAGKSAIDQLLLGRSSEDIKAARAAAMGLGRSTYQNIASAREAGRAAERSAAAFGQETGQMLESETGALDAEIQRQMDEAVAAEQGRKSTFANIQNILAGKAATDAKKGGAVSGGTQVVGGAVRQQLNPTEMAMAELESSGLLSPEQLNSLKGLYSGAQGVGKSLARTDLMERLKKRELNLASNDKNVDKDPQIQLMRKALSNDSSLNQYIQSENQRIQSLYDKAVSRGDKKAIAGLKDSLNRYSNMGLNQEQIANLINKSISQKEAQNLTKMGMIDPEEATKFQALAKLAGKDSLYQPVAPEALYKAGGVGTETQRIKQIQDYAQQIEDLRKSGTAKYYNNDKGDTGGYAFDYGYKHTNRDKIDRLANLLRNYGV